MAQSETAVAVYDAGSDGCHPQGMVDTGEKGYDALSILESCAQRVYAYPRGHIHVAFAGPLRSWFRVR